MKACWSGIIAVTLALSFQCAAPLRAQAPPKVSPHSHPWDDRTLSPDQRADLVQKELSLDEKIQLVHGIGWGVLMAGQPVPADDNGGAGFVTGIDRLGIPPINQQDSAVGVRLSSLMGR